MNPRPINPEPFRIEPDFKPRIWGARSLAPLYPEKNNLSEPIGEAWLTGVDCRTATGPFAGQPLGQAWKEMPIAWRGSEFQDPAEFPLLLKFIFPADKLSIQVHPGDAYAAKHEAAAGGRGKTEMWHVVSAEPGARLLAGLKPGVTKEKFLAALADHSLENLFQAYVVHAGDTFFIPPGTPHTIGPGMIVCEVQEYSDLTYRMYDYDRRDANGSPRQLHIEKALAVTNFGPNTGGRISPLSLQADGATINFLAGCRYFSSERWECSARTAVPVDSSRFELLIVLEGRGSFSSHESSFAYQRGQCWFLPASTGKVAVVPGTHSSFIRARVARLADVRMELSNRGASQAAISKIVFD